MISITRNRHFNIPSSHRTRIGYHMTLCNLEGRKVDFIPGLILEGVFLHEIETAGQELWIGEQLGASETGHRARLQYRVEIPGYIPATGYKIPRPHFIHALRTAFKEDVRLDDSLDARLTRAVERKTWADSTDKFLVTAFEVHELSWFEFYFRGRQLLYTDPAHSRFSLIENPPLFSSPHNLQ